MAFHGCKCTSKVNRADDDEDYRPGVRKGKVTAARLVEQEKHAERDDDRGAHEAPAGAAAARATDTITHRDSSSTNLLAKNGG